MQGTVTLGQPAASGGVIVALTSNNPNAARVPSIITVPAGQFTTNFTITTFSVTLPSFVTISGTFVATTSAPLTVMATLPPAPGNIAIDALIAKDQAVSANSVTSGTLSTSIANELILAFVATDALSSNTTVTSITGAGLPWSLVQRTNSQLGTSEIWRAFAPSPLTNTSVTANLSQSVNSSMLVMSFAGVDPSGTNGSGAIGAIGSGSAGSGAPTALLTTTRSNSLVLGIGNDWDNPIARTVGTNQTLLHQYLSTTGDTYWMQMQSAPIPSSGTAVTINDTSPTTDRYNLSLVEVRPAPAATFSISGSVSPAANGSGTTLAASGSVNSTTTADATGNYSLTGLTNGSYTVTPSKIGFVFTPTSQPVTVSGISITGINFTAAALTSIAVTPANPSIQAGNTQPFTATGTYSDNGTQNISAQVTWSSSNTGVATINSSGLATAIAAGSSSITAKLGSVSGSTTFTVLPLTLAVTTSTLPNGFQTQAYSAGLAASGGTAPYSWSLANNTALPPGLNLSSGGQITGAPTIVGTTTFTVQVADSGTPAQIATQPLSITIAASGCPCGIAGTISGSGGNTATVTLTGGINVTADASGNFNVNGLSNGTYTVTPAKSGYVFTPTSKSVVVGGTSVTGVNFSSTAQLGIDQTVSTDRSSNATTIVSPSFSTTKPNELLLAFVATDATAANMTVTGVTGAGLTWTMVKRTNTQLGTAEIWRAFSSTTLSSVPVTATLAKSVAASITVVTLTGADPSGTGGSGAIGNTGTGNANPGAPTAQLTTTRNNSWVFGVGNDYDNAIARTAGPNQTIIHFYLATIGDTYWVQRQNTTTPTSGTVVTLNDTAPTADRYNLSLCEVLPAP